jgi:hypothetical protein
MTIRLEEDEQAKRRDRCLGCPHHSYDESLDHHNGWFCDVKECVKTKQTWEL